MKNILKLIVLLSMLSISLTIKANSPTFSASPVLPENQISGEAFFDLRVKPNQQQDLIISIRNETLETIKVKIEPITATTGRNGEIIYSKQGISDVSLKHPFTSLIEGGPQIVEIPAKTDIEVSTVLTTPKQSFDGIILGALHLSEITANVESKGIKSIYDYTIAVRLSEKDKELEPDILFDEVELISGKATSALLCNIRNPQPALFKNSKVFAQIRKGSAIVASENINVGFAPNSIYSLLMKRDSSWDLGDYSVLIRTTLENGSVFTFENVLTIDTKSSDVDYKIDSLINQERPPARGPINLKNTNVLIIVGITILTIAIIGTITIKIIKKRQRTQDLSD